ncbi:MAG: DUF4395 domain-containing protein [Sulfurimonas sp.]|jgi:hypothetical protein|nr:DUF4395 domain-containing protein [Sulfurimonas sp.]MBU1217494.1 DUF4395 domain-containing protein [bacterium]MBU1433760.1 DUF4395 domain-containing protein [bacterium]MBU1503835.1 DUF4395 domain-containing protein [bacterium]MBU3939119.1 DUF4395 domain-containing protein [bacterium]
MSYSCPMSFKQIDSNVSRLTSLFVSISVILYLIYGFSFILYIIAFDFIMRLFITKDSSIFYMSALFMKEIFNIKDKFVDSGAKRLAAYFGLIFVLILLVCHYLELQVLLLSVAAIFLTCSLLDVFLDFCLGCKIYYIIKKIYPNFMS